MDDLYESLFGDWGGGRHNDHPEERARVRVKIGPIVMEYARLKTGESFHAEELRRYVLDRSPATAPESPGRCLRDLRQYGLLNYKVIDRTQSLYLFVHLDADSEEECDE